MIRIKPGVELNNLSPQMVVALLVVASVFRESFKKDCIITSGSDGDHTTIVHYIGQALDFRVLHLEPSERLQVRRLVEDALGGEGSQYDVVLKKYGTGDCLHVEFDPR